MLFNAIKLCYLLEIFVQRTVCIIVFKCISIKVFRIQLCGLMSKFRVHILLILSAPSLIFLISEAREITFQWCDSRTGVV